MSANNNFDESKVRRDRGRFATKGYDDSGQVNLGPQEGPGSESWNDVAQHLEYTGYAPKRVELTAVQTVDVRDIAAECRGLYATVTDDAADIDDRAEALATLRDRTEAINQMAFDANYDESTAADGWENVAMEQNSTLCREDQFADYLREDAVEIGLVSPEMSNFVDWERFAEAQMSNYADVEIGGDTFWYRA